jgi:uncharacterized membrane protein
MYNTLSPIVRGGWESSDVAPYFTITSVLVFTLYIITALFGSRMPSIERILIVLGLLGALVLTLSFQFDFSELKNPDMGVLIFLFLHCLFLFIIPSILLYFNMKVRHSKSSEANNSQQTIPYTPPDE